MKLQYTPLLILVLFASTIYSDDTNTEPLYHELYRPAYHFSPPQNWMNDPNGLVYFGGKYHLYYQYNPFGIDWGDMSWGHATSTDLVHWEHWPVAIPEYSGVMIFSGCIIIDVNNTSGFCDPESDEGCMLAYYTAQTGLGGDHPIESQAFAYSNDQGLTFTEYPDNPIIDENKHDFRDPKVFWYEPEAKWVMITSLSDIYKVRLFGSKDLIHWEHLSDFGFGSQDGCWEDPDLFPLVDDEGNQKWILTHAVNVDKVEYYIGHFDGTTFTNTDTPNEILFIDYGKDFDEAATWNNEPNGRRLMVAWLNEGAYGGAIPEKVWRGQLTLIRELKLRRYPEGLRIVQGPLEEMQELRYSPNHYENIELNKTNHIYKLPTRATQMEIIAEFTYNNESDDTPIEFGINVFVGGSQRTVVGYDVVSERLFIDRTFSGFTNFSNAFTDVSYAKLEPENGRIKLHIFIDNCSVEVFANDGKIAMSDLVFPDPELDEIQIYTIGGSITVTSVDTWLMKSIWDDAPSSQVITQ